MRRIFLAIAMICIGFPGLSHAQESFFVPEQPIPEVKPPGLFDGIEKARTMLRERIEERKRANPEPVIVASKGVARNVVLAVWNRVTGAVDLVDAVKDDAKLTLKTPYEHVIKVTRDNGVNSRYEVVGAADKVVVGIIFPTAKDITTNKKKPQYELVNKTYVPYNSSFFTPEVLRKGSDYLSYLLKDAYDELRLRGVKSRAFPDKLLADVADPYLVKSIAIIEHIDTQIFETDDSEQAVGRFLITLALNGEDAFDFSVSSAGARGLVQFMPGTYRALAKKRPELHLIEDFIPAMADHTNAVKAQVALLDENLMYIPKEVRALWLTERGRVAPFLAAAYNGGPSRVTKSYAIWGDAWSVYRMPQMEILQAKADASDARTKQLKKLLAKKGLTAKEIKQYKSELAKLTAERPKIRTEYHAIKNNSLYRETAKYVEKLNKVYDMLAAGLYATPNALDGGIGREIATR